MQEALAPSARLEHVRLHFHRLGVLVNQSLKVCARELRLTCRKGSGTAFEACKTESLRSRLSSPLFNGACFVRQ